MTRHRTRHRARHLRSTRSYLWGLRQSNGSTTNPFWCGYPATYYVNRNPSANSRCSNRGPCSRIIRPLPPIFRGVHLHGSTSDSQMITHVSHFTNLSNAGNINSSNVGMRLRLANVELRTLTFMPLLHFFLPTQALSGRTI